MILQNLVCLPLTSLLQKCLSMSNTNDDTAELGMPTINDSIAEMSQYAQH
jgi:hypothetical protein